jgi:hypothetical membrane protein
MRRWPTDLDAARVLYVGTVTIRAGALLWIVAAVAYFAAEAIAAEAIVPAYDYATDYISTLGAASVSPRSDLVNAAFFFQGAAFGIGAVLVAVGIRAGRAPWFLGFAAANAVGNVLVGAVSAQPGGGPVWHVVGAALAIVGGNAAVLAGSSLVRRAGGSRSYRSVSVALAVIGFGCLVALQIGAAHAVLPVGVWERGSVYPIFVWQTLTGAYLIVRRAGR